MPFYSWFCLGQFYLLSLRILRKAGELLYRMLQVLVCPIWVILRLLYSLALVGHLEITLRPRLAFGLRQFFVLSLLSAKLTGTMLNSLIFFVIFWGSIFCFSGWLPTQCVVKDSLPFLVILLPYLKCCHYRPVLPHLDLAVVGILEFLLLWRGTMTMRTLIKESI